MRTFIFLLCTTVFGFTSNGVFSQNEKITIDADKSVTVDEIFEIIKEQTDYHFVYRSEMFDGFPKVQLSKGVITLNNLLEKSLNNENFKFQFTSNHNIIIKEADAQQIVVSGTVTDKTGLPIPGVNIYNEAKTHGVATDFDGKFQLRLPSDNETLVFSYVGYIEKHVPLSELNNRYGNIVIVLEENINTLDEVVVTGYQELSIERTAGSFDSVDDEQLQQRPSSPNIIERLEGQVSGLSSNPLRPGLFEIRGRSSVTDAFSRPLIVVDGFPLTDQLNFESINPEDVESVTVLKDASASSIWGSRASNGVIVIVTKKGKKNTGLNVDFSVFSEIENKVDLSDNDWLSTAEEIDLDTEFIEKGWVNLENVAKDPKSINDFHLAHLYRNGLSPDGNVWSQNTFDNFINDLKTKDIEKDWEKYLLRNAIRTTYNLNLSGGGDKNSFYGSLSYTNKLDQSIGDKNDRITMNLRNVFDYNDHISITAGLSATIRNETENGLESRYESSTAAGSVSLAKLAQPYDTLIDEDGQYIQRYYDWNPWVSQEREALTGSAQTFNYLEEQRNRDVNASAIDIRADVQLDVEIIKDLTFSSSFRYEHNSYDRDYFKSMTLPSWRNTVNNYYVLDGSRYVNQIPLGSEYYQQNSYSKGWVLKNTLTWDKDWKDHKLTVFGGGEYSRRFYENSNNRQFGYDKSTTTYIPVDETALLGYGMLDFNGNPFTRYYSTSIFDVNNQDDRFVSVYSNLGYTFKKKYTLNGSFRIDQANLFGSNPDFRYKPLWSVGAAWTLDKEGFMQNINWINHLKIRATYGLGGNSLSGVSPYATARIRNESWGNQYNSLYLSQPANPDLKWEQTATTDLGLDFAFLNNRISGSFDYYRKYSTDVYTSRDLDPTVGFNYAQVNYGTIENKGFEVVLNADIIRNKNFTWSLGANFNTNENKIIDLENAYPATIDDYNVGSTYIIGEPMGALKVYNFAGLDANGEVLLYDTDGNTKLWSEKVEVEELISVGSRIPKNYGGLTTTFRYKGLDLTINMNYQTGFVFRVPYSNAGVGAGTYNNSEYDFSNTRVHKIWGDRWMQPGDEATTNVPRLFYDGLNPNTGLYESRYNQSTMSRTWQYSNENTLKGDYLRVQDIILGYNMPANYLEPTFFKRVRLTMQVANPFLFVANDAGVDPTTASSGSQAYTNLTRFTLGLRATF